MTPTILAPTANLRELTERIGAKTSGAVTAELGQSGVTNLEDAFKSNRNPEIAEFYFSEIVSAIATTGHDPERDSLVTAFKVAARSIYYKMTPTKDTHPAFVATLLKNLDLENDHGFTIRKKIAINTMVGFLNLLVNNSNGVKPVALPYASDGQRTKPSTPKQKKPVVQKPPAAGAGSSS